MYEHKNELIKFTDALKRMSPFNIIIKRKIAHEFCLSSIFDTRIFYILFLIMLDLLRYRRSF